MPINYNPQLNKTAGFYKIVQDDQNPVSSADANTLLHFLFWFLYTKEGRDFGNANSAASNAITEGQIRANFVAKLQEFGLTDDGLQEAVINGHVSAGRWVRAHDSNTPDQMDFNSKIYQQNLSFIVWTLWENAQAHEFSLGW